MTEPTAKPPRRQPKRTKGDKGGFAKIPYDPAVLLKLWHELGNEPTVAKLHKKLLESGMDVSFAWVEKVVARHKIVALGAMQGLDDKTALLNVSAIKSFLTSIGKDVNPHDLLQGLQVRTITVIHDHLNLKDVAKIDPAWLGKMMEAYKLMGEEVLRDYQKRVQAGEKVELPVAKVDDEKVTPFTSRRK